jgi:uncharacterized protein YdcH (DUF465 family)
MTPEEVQQVFDEEPELQALADQHDALEDRIAAADASERRALIEERQLLRYRMRKLFEFIVGSRSIKREPGAHQLYK